MTSGPDGTKATRTSTRAFLGTYKLIDYLFDVRAYHVAGRSIEEAILPKRNVPMTFYEVAVFAEGSWWLPTSTVEDSSWGGSTSLSAQGDIPAWNVLRPRNYFLWIPRQSLESVFLPFTLAGRVEGDVPLAPPASHKGPS